MKMKNKKVKTSKIILVLACTMAVLYAIADFLLQYFTNIELSPTLTGCWYTFWGVELINLATIKNTKTKNNNESEEE
jgi:hypothetical protein